MKYPYISALPVVSEAMDELRNVTRSTSFTEEDCYSFAVDVARMIGGHNYDTEECYLDVKKHATKLPGNFYRIDELALCGSFTDTDRVGIRPAPAQPIYPKTHILAPADSNSMKYCTRGCMRGGGTYTFTVKCPPGILRTGINTGKLYLRMLVLPMVDGIVQIQDEINEIQAIKNYIKMMLLQEKFVIGEIPATVYGMFKQDFEDYLLLAQQKQKAFDPAHTDYYAVKQDQRYAKFNYRNQ